MPATGRGSAIFISRMASGTANAFCPRVMSNSSVHQRQLGWPTNSQSMAAFFGSMVSASIPSHENSYYMAGAGGQITMIVPSHDLVVVRLGHYKGEASGTAAFQRALPLLMEAVPRRN